MESTGEKTEKASQKRLKDARERGQVPRSRDMATAMALLGVTMTLGKLGGMGVQKVATRIAAGFSHLGDRPLSTISPGQLGQLVLGDLGLFAIIAGPIALTAATVSVSATISQTGFVFATEALTLKWENLSPSRGLARFKPAQAGLDLIKAAFMATAVGVLAYSVVQTVVADSPRLAWLTPSAAAFEGWNYVSTLLWRAGFALFALAGADYGLQFWRHRTSLKMTKQEVRDESKSNDGNPEIKARVRKVQREMTRRRMLSNVKKATVVITNPTHFAVAIEYRRGAMAAPLVLAKGADHMAARIKALARTHGVPVVENVSLAQALFKGAEVGDTIPAALFSAVAEVLAYLVRIKQLML